ncbi:MAG TPA: organic hydroperoxide resistance protein [Solirubrobacteraceae bacterium]|jgi:Ohr subfamily peroxiredoxin|nr:organic hydroperoxide resistance protein [Solirubrobacteraceae bacterium]
MKILYTAEATASGGRNGISRTPDGNMEVRLVPPVELGGPGGEGTNPEQLFALGYAGCFDNALLLIAAGKKLNADDSSVTARVAFGPLEDRPGWGLAVTLRVELPHLDQETAQRLVERTDKACPYSNAVRGNIPLEFEVHAGSALAAPA